MCVSLRKSVSVYGLNLLEGQGGLVSILVPEVVVHPKVCLTPQLISGLTVWDAFYHPTLEKEKEEKDKEENKEEKEKKDEEEKDREVSLAVSNISDCMKTPD